VLEDKGIENLTRLKLFLPEFNFKLQHIEPADLSLGLKDRLRKE